MADTKPDLTIILDLPAEQGLERAKNRNGDNKETDRFEAMDLAFHEALRKAFLEIAEQEKERCIVIDATGSEDEISDQVWEAVVERFNP